MDNYVITVARGFGSGGKTIASRIAKHLGISCYENRILTLASQYSGIDEHDFQQVDEKLGGNFIMRELKKFPAARKYIPVDRDFASDDKLFQYQCQIIKKLAEEESCVIVGKCADYVLRDYPRRISIYIEAPREACVRRTIEHMDVNSEEAERLFMKTDQYRTDYYRYYTGGLDWRSPVNYDLILNSERVGLDGCVEIIEAYVKKKFLI